MKLRLIALSGLLGAGLMMTSACSSDDADPAINPIVTKSSVVITEFATQSHELEFEDTSDSSRSLVTFCSDINKRFLTDDENGTWEVAGNIVTITFPTLTATIDTLNGKFEKNMPYLIETTADDSTETVLRISETVCPDVINSPDDKSSVAIAEFAIQSYTLEFEDTSDGSSGLVSFCSDTNKRFLSDDENGTWEVTGNVVTITFSGETVTIDTLNGTFEKNKSYFIDGSVDDSTETVRLISETVCPAAL